MLTAAGLSALLGGRLTGVAAETRLHGVAALLDAGLDVRQADLLLHHLADPNELAVTWSRVEQHAAE